MEDMQSGINAILNNPQMMEQIMAMAQSMQAPAPPEAPAPTPSSSPQLPEFDLSMIQKLSRLAGNATIDKNQQNLIHALSPYISNRRIEKLEKAMRAAKLASFATTFLGSNFFDPGR